ncbi:hypothetical protein SETIT_2G103000v2 [Setaria italica]|uniref:WRKY domain-containing protein n=1 Tax=Setaria italica TaxID=4555 RepID=A0A368PXG3_SETIT|nr:hypothetical protein SETIT_2G103000v2 [Setaria italica]
MAREAGWKGLVVVASWVQQHQATETIVAVSKSGHGEEEAPAGSVGEAEHRGREVEAAADPQVGVNLDCSIRRLFQQLVHVRAAISSSSSGSRPSDAWLNGMILAMLDVGRHRKKAVSNVSGTSSPEELAILSITDKLEGLQLGSPGLSGAAIDIHNEMLSLPSLVMRCILLSLLYLDLSSCSGLTQLPPSIGNLHNLAALNLSDCYSLQTLRSLPVSLCQLSKLRLLDLAGCFSLEYLPDPPVNLGHLENLNLSDCKQLKVLPQPFVDLHELKYLNLSGNHGVDLDAEYLCTLANLKCVTLSPITNVQGFPDSFLGLAIRLDRLRWWKNKRVHQHCNPKAASMHSYRCYDQSIINRLLSDEDDISSDKTVTSICIVGESGMGKTELAGKFTRLLAKIVEFTSCAYCIDAPISALEEIVIEELTGKRLLLVLEDSDSKSQYLWSYVQRLLNVCAKGSALIVTSKSNEVANLVGGMQTYYLSPLSKEECFMIFKGHVLGGLDMSSYPELESIGWKVVEKSGGNPMCIKALSGLLCPSEIDLSETDMLVDSTLPALLRLCYDLLPAHLQHCFKFCSLFPKGHIFIKHHIIRLWISQGFRHPFLNFQDDEFVMHELFHDLATSVSKNQYFRCEEPFSSLAENIGNLSIVLSDFKTVALAKEARNLQYIVELPRSIGNMKHLRLLSLNNTNIKGLPFEIGQVDTPQTLELKDCCQLTDLPETTSNLVKLRHLDIQKEPGNIKVGVPRGIGQLTDLQTLTEFNIGNNLSQCSIAELKNLNGLKGHVHVPWLENIKALPKTMGDDASEANIVGKDFLEALMLEWSYSDDNMDDCLGHEIANKILRNLQPNSNLQKLIVRNYAGNLFPLWMQEPYLIKLVSITLDNCYGCSELPYLGDLPCLKFLFIQRMNSIESFGIGSNSLATEEKHPPRFPSLEVLTLWEMYYLQFWVGINEGDFPRICHLSISRCPKLTNLPCLVSLVHLSVHYGDLRVVRCPKLDLVGISLEDHHRQKVDGGRKSPTKRSMVLKAATDTNLQDDGWKSYYCRCLNRHSTGCCATKILHPGDTDPNMLCAMYISEHNHEPPQ